jgi:hypothetical protein
MKFGEDVSSSTLLVLRDFEAGVLLVNPEIEAIPPHFFLGHQHPQPA